MKLSGLYFLIMVLGVINTITSQVTGCQHNKTMGVATSLYNSPENLRSDTIDVIKYTINLDITDFANQKIKGNTIVRFAPKLNSQTKINLDLLKMTIDSVKQNNAICTYSYNDTLLKVNFSSVLNTTDTSDVIVFYQGTPQGD